MERSKLIFGSMAAALCIFGGAIFLQTSANHKLMRIAEAQAKLSMGKAPLQIVLIEDFECRSCMAFSQKVIPKIRREYVDQGRAQFILIPVSFLSGSQAIGNAVLEVHRQAPDQVFAYLEKVLNQYETNALQPLDLVQLARKIEGVELPMLQQAIETGRHNRELQKNLGWAKMAMGSRFKTPALYINGEPSSTFSFEAIQYQIDQLIGQQ